MSPRNHYWRPLGTSTPKDLPLEWPWQQARKRIAVGAVEATCLEGTDHGLCLVILCQSGNDNPTGRHKA